VVEQARRELGVRVAACFVDVRRPTPADALADLPGPCVAVPMFLAAGYHVRADVPEQLRATGRGDVLIAETFGPDPALVAAAADRLVQAGARPGDAVVLAVAASSDPHAQADGARAARRLGRLLGGPVTLAPIVLGDRRCAGGPEDRHRPGVADVVARLRADGAKRVAVASWLLAPGLFQRNVDRCGADVVADPLADHAAVLQVIRSRYDRAMEAERRPA
jgi:sirohydrochlorin ferrochelatase